MRTGKGRAAARRIAGLILAASLPGVVAAHAEPNLTGYRLILDDEFDGSSLDLDRWQVGTNPRNMQWGSDSYFVPKDSPLFSQVYRVADGVLTIRAIYDPTFVDPSKWGRHWYSGMIGTAFSDRRPPSAAFRRGYVEVRQKMPAGRGVWPGNWAINLKSMSAKGDPLGTVELDGLESYGHNPTGFNTNVHDWGDKSSKGAAIERLPPLSDAFHTYGYLVTDKELQVFFDGAPKAKLPLPRPDTLDSFFWMFNLAMGSGWPIDVPASGHYDLQIDWIRIYVPREDTAPAAAAGPSP